MTEQGEVTGDKATETTAQVLGEANLKTTRLQQERASEYWESIVESISDGFWVFDRSWHCTYINNRQASLVGMPKEEVVGKNVWDLFPDLVGTEVYRQLHQAVAEQTPVHFEHFSSTWQGWFELRVYPSANGVSIFTIDISDAYRQASQRKQTEEVLQDRQYFLQQLAEMSPGLLYLYDVVEQRNIYINQRSLELLGYPPETVLAMGTDFMHQVMHPDDLAQMPAHVERLNTAQDGSLFELDYRMRHVKGEWRWFSSRDTVFSRTAQGQVRQILGTAQDITERKRAEEALRESEERFQAFMNHSPASAWIADEQGRLLYLSPTYFRMFQFPVQDVLGKNIFDIYPAEFAQQFIDNNKQVFETKQVIETIESAPRPDGSVGEFLVYKFPIPSGEEILLGGVAVDITDRRRTEEALRDSEQQLKIALQTAKLGSWQHDLVTGTLSCSEQCKANVGLPPDAEFSHETLFALLHPEDHALVEAAIQRTLEEHTDYEVEERCFWPDGSLHWLIARGSLVCDSDGTPVRLVGVTLDITERKQFEESLKAAHQRISNILASITDAFVTLDSQWCYSYVNQEAARLLQRSPEELLGKRWHELFPEAAQSNKFFAQELERSVAEQVTVKFEAFCAAANCWLEVSAFPFPDGLSIYFWDISDRKRAENALRESEIQLQRAAQRFELAAAAVNCLIYDWDVQQDIVYRTEGLTQILGYSLEEAKPTSQWWRERVHPEDLQRVQNEMEATLANSDRCITEYRVRNKDNQYVYVVDHGIVARDADGRIMRVVGSTIDISDRKQAEAERERLLQRERAANELLQLFIEHAPAAVAMLDRQMCYLFTSRRWLQEYGAGYTSLTGLSHYDVVPDMPDGWRGVHQRCLAGATERREEDYFVPADGSAIWLHWEVLPWYTSGGDIGGIIIFAENITERKQAEQEREQLLERERVAREQAENANRIKDEFLAVLSHELRSPLNPILGWTKLLRSRKFDEKATDRALETIERNAKLQTQLIEDLLDVSRILQGKMVLDTYPVNLATTIEAALETVRLAAQAKDIQIQTVLDTNVGNISGDANRLQQVVWNLVSNAVKFTPSRGWVEVRLEKVEQELKVSRLKVEGSEDNVQPSTPTQPSTQYAQIQVRDNGKGISPEFLPHVFEYFRQADGTTTRTFGGLGLGLAIVRHLVELHGGSVLADSLGEGLGATFTVRLPLMETSPEVPQEVPSDSFGDLGGLHVLIVDDEADIRDLVAFILEQAGAEVTVTTSASEALAALNQSLPDVLLCDIGMPGVDGYMLMRQVRALPPERGGLIPAIALTAYAGESNQKQALAAGFQLHISKPVEPEELVRAIAHLMATDNET